MWDKSECPTVLLRLPCDQELPTNSWAASRGWPVTYSPLPPGHRVTSEVWGSLLSSLTCKVRTASAPNVWQGLAQSPARYVLCVCDVRDLPSPPNSFFQEGKRRIREWLYSRLGSWWVVKDSSHGLPDPFVGFVLSQHSWPNTGRCACGGTCQRSLPPSLSCPFPSSLLPIPNSSCQLWTRLSAGHTQKFPRPALCMLCAMGEEGLWQLCVHSCQNTTHTPGYPLHHHPDFLLLSLLNVVITNRSIYFICVLLQDSSHEDELLVWCS